MTAPNKFFSDGAGYERMMGRWSRMAGEKFLDWLALPSGLRCLDVGCGNGAFTEVLIARCAPAAVMALDPSEEPDRLCTAAARCEARRVSRRRRAGLAVRQRQLRCGADGAGHLLRARCGEGRGGNGARGAAGRMGCHLHVGYPGRRNAGCSYEFVRIKSMGLAPQNAPNAAAVADAKPCRNCGGRPGFNRSTSRVIRIAVVYSDFDDFWGDHVRSRRQGPWVDSLKAMSPSAKRAIARTVA